MLGTITKLDKAFGNGGVGYVKGKADNIDYFFHARNVHSLRYLDLKIGQLVAFRPIAAKFAMGASPRATLITNAHEIIE